MEKIAKPYLADSGFTVRSTSRDITPGDTVSDALELAIKKIPCTGRYASDRRTSASGTSWRSEAYVQQWASKDARMIPVILPGVKETPDLPLFVGQALVGGHAQLGEGQERRPFSDWSAESWGKAPGDSPEERRFGFRDVAE